MIRKGLWFATTFAMSALALFFTYRNIDEYLNSDVVTLLNTTTASLSDIYFPTVTICNVNQVSQSFLSSVNLDIAEDGEVTQMLFSQFIDGDPREFLEYASAGESNPRFEQNLKALRPTMDLVERMYGWSERREGSGGGPQNGTFEPTSFAAVASQNCSGLVLFAEWKRNVSHTGSSSSGFMKICVNWSEESMNA